jgi:hypothetical protein
MSDHLKNLKGWLHWKRLELSRDVWEADLYDSEKAFADAIEHVLAENERLKADLKKSDESWIREAGINASLRSLLREARAGMDSWNTGDLRDRIDAALGEGER